MKSINAFLFGWLAVEIELISKNIMPVILLHFLFAFESKIVAMNEIMLMLAECARGAVVFIAAIWLATVIQRNRY